MTILLVIDAEAPLRGNIVDHALIPSADFGGESVQGAHTLPPLLEIATFEPTRRSVQSCRSSGLV